MKWETPSYTDLRFGFEVTMYICNRRSGVDFRETGFTPCLCGPVFLYVPG